MRKLTLLHFGEKGHLQALIGCLSFPADEPSSKPASTAALYHRFRTFRERWGQMSEKAVFVRSSNMDYIIFCYQDFPSDWHTTLVFAPSSDSERDCVAS